MSGAPANVTAMNIDICKLKCISGTPIYRLEWIRPILQKRIIQGGKISKVRTMYTYTPKVFEEL